MMTIIVLQCLIEAFTDVMFIVALVMLVREVILYFREVPFIIRKNKQTRRP